MLSATDWLLGDNLRPTQNRAATFQDGKIGTLSNTLVAGPRRLVVPGLVNAHDHARPLSTTSFGGANKPLESWLLRLAVMPATDPYLAALASLGRAARTGCISVMAHYTRLHGPMTAPDEAALVAKAAAAIGVRVTFALAIKDRNPLVYGDSAPVLAQLPDAARSEVEAIFGKPAMPYTEQIALVEACAAAAEGPLCSVQYGPSGMQWCSNSMLEAIAEASARTGRRVHMHLLETKYQRAFADANYPQGVVRFLKDIGLLSPRLTLAHCVYARPDELELIAECGTTIATNFSSNLHLRSGIAPIAEAFRRGCRVTIGMDSSAMDEDDDVLREMRLAHFAHAGWGFDGAISREDFLRAIVRNGRFANDAPGSGTLAEGQAADMVVLDLEKLDRDTLMPVNPLDYLFARANASHVAEVIVAGQTIARDGALVNIDLEAVQTELRARYRRDLSGKAGYLAAWPHVEAAVSGYFKGMAGCC